MFAGGDGERVLREVDPEGGAVRASQRCARGSSRFPCRARRRCGWSPAPTSLPRHRRAARDDPRRGTATAPGPSPPYRPRGGTAFPSSGSRSPSARGRRSVRRGRRAGAAPPPARGRRQDRPRARSAKSCSPTVVTFNVVFTPGSPASLLDSRRCWLCSCPPSAPSSGTWRSWRDGGLGARQLASACGSCSTPRGSWSPPCAAGAASPESWGLRRIDTRRGPGTRPNRDRRRPRPRDPPGSAAGRCAARGRRIAEDGPFQQVRSHLLAGTERSVDAA